MNNVSKSVIFIVLTYKNTDTVSSFCMEIMSRCLWMMDETFYVLLNNGG